MQPSLGSAAGRIRIYSRIYSCIYSRIYSGIYSGHVCVDCRMNFARTVFGAALMLATGTAAAHDTWFQSGAADAQGLRLALGTGNRFPAMQTGVDAVYLSNQGCRGAGAAGPVTPMTPAAPAGLEQAALELRGPAGASTCWAQLKPFEIELPADKIALYLDEIQASAELRARWAEMAGRGVKWFERYTKHARIEFAGAGSAPVAMGMDMLLEGEPGRGPVRVGDALNFRVLRDGQPLAGFAVELRGDASRFGIWRRTDAQGRVALKAPLAGRWVLRGVDLRLSATERDVWESRFATLAFDVLPKSANRGTQ